MINQRSIALLVLLSVLTLTSCSRGVVKTVDASVEYQSAKNLPSLTKERPASSVDSDTTQSVAISEKIKSVTANTVKDKENIPRLSINSKVDVAWEYLDVRLQQANITVYNRNQEAGLFSIGCADTADSVKKKRGWFSFKSRKKVKDTEYCTLKIERARRKSTSVSMLNRQGDAVSGPYVDSLFKRILNN